MNPHAPKPASVQALARSLWSNRALILQMVRREVVGRYKGSAMGLVWSFINPVLMLLVYTFVFSVVFKARWGGGDETRSQFAIVLFAGLIIHGLFAEVINRAPTLVLSNVNYVKKVVFPIEVLPVVSLGAALFHACVSLAVLLAASLLLNSFVPWTALLAPVVILPLVVLILGVGWMLSAMGVFVRDLAQLVAMASTVLLFLSPVFYSVETLPEFLRPWMLLNPLTFIIEQARDVLIWGRAPHWGGLMLYLLAASVVAWIGYFLFQKTRKGFADVL